jgi:hypothetical protein
MQLEAELWGAINGYAIAIGGVLDHVPYDNVARMKAVDHVRKVVARVRSRERIDDIVIEDLAKAGSGAAAAAGKFRTEVDRLRMVLIGVRGFLRGVAQRPELGRGAQDLLDEAETLDRVLDEKKEPRG